MTRWWKRVALTAAWLGLNGTAAWGQYPTLPPGPIGAARMPEPAPTGPPKPVPELMPGPISPLAAPPGPGRGTDLPANHSSAFQCEDYPLEERWYASVGPQFLQRNGLGGATVAVMDPINIKDGIATMRGSPSLQNLTHITPDMNAGIRATIGYLWNSEAIEITGNYIFSSSAKPAHVALPGQIDTQFTNAPFGFSGDNGLFIHADVLRTTHTNELANAEINYRRWNGGVNGLELILGVRYSYVRDQLNIFVGDDDLTFLDVNGKPDPLRQATYNVEVKNNIVAPQVGFEYQTPLPSRLLDWIFIGSIAKAAVGPNFLTTNTSLTRGDGFPGFNVSHTTVSLSQIYEINGFVDFHFLSRGRLRAGYTAMWFVDVGTSVDTLDFNLSNTGGRSTKSGSIFYHGPFLELQFLF